MKASKFTEAQIAFVLKQAEDGTPVAEVSAAEILAIAQSVRARVQRCFDREAELSAVITPPPIKPLSMVWTLPPTGPEDDEGQAEGRGNECTIAPVDKSDVA